MKEFKINILNEKINEVFNELMEAERDNNKELIEELTISLDALEAELTFIKECE